MTDRIADAPLWVVALSLPIAFASGLIAGHVAFALLRLAGVLP